MESVDHPLEIQWESCGNPLKFNGNPNGIRGQQFGNDLDIPWKSIGNHVGIL